MDIEAAVLFAPNAPLRLLQLAAPKLQPGQVLVDVAWSGVCHSQLLEFQGKRGPDRFLPHTLGHEGSGTVLEVGPGIEKVRPGDRVVLSWIKGSGQEVPSTVYGSTEGPVNSGAISTFMRQTVTCENRVTRIPEAMPLREAALLGCAIPTGAGAVIRTAGARPGDSVAIFGVGGVGLGAVLGAGLVHSAQVIAIDLHDHKLELARSLGATHTVHAGRENPVARIRELTGGRGADVAIDAAGRRETMEAAFEAVRDGGGLCVLAGNLPPGERIALDPFALIRGRRIVGTWGGETVPDRDIPAYAELFLAGKLPLEGLITHDYGLAEANHALDDLSKGRVGRALLDLAVP